MRYSGRIFTVAIYLVLIFIVKLYGAIYYDVPFSNLPIFAIIIVPISYFLGRQYDMVKFLSEKDSLTSLYNRRYVIQTFPNIADQANKTSKTLRLYIIDIDHFKIINDTFGHEMGDRVLKHIAAILQANVRKTDLVARWAGDEFLIISPSSDETSHHRITHGINQKLKQAFPELNRQISVSIGFSVYYNDASTLDALLNIADHKMYEQKSQSKTT